MLLAGYLISVIIFNTRVTVLLQSTMLGNVCLSDTLAHTRYEFVTVSKKDQAANEFSIAQQDTGETRNNNYPNINLRMASYQED